MSQTNIKFRMHNMAHSRENPRHVNESQSQYEPLTENILGYEEEYTGLSANHILFELNEDDYHHHGLSDYLETELISIFRHIQPVMYISITFIIGVIIYSIMGNK